LSLCSVACVAGEEEEADLTVEAEETTLDLVSRSARFDTFQGVDGRYYFRFVAGNGEIVLRSQAYKSRRGAEVGVASVLENGNDKRNYEILEAKNGQFYFNLKAKNGEVIGTSELYVSRWNAERGAATVRALIRIEQQKTAE
jgi:uncharacterized protein YegP (UPF0339 family)